MVGGSFHGSGSILDDLECGAVDGGVLDRKDLRLQCADLGLCLAKGVLVNLLSLECVARACASRKGRGQCLGHYQKVKSPHAWQHLLFLSPAAINAAALACCSVA